MKRIKCVGLLLLLICMVGCGPSPVAVIEVGPEGVVSHGKRGEETFTWDRIQGLSRENQLSSENHSYPVLRIQTQESKFNEVASSYSERVDPKSYGGLYIHYSISPADFEEVQALIVKGAGLTAQPNLPTEWVREKDAKVEPPIEKKVFFKKIGS